MSFNLLSSIIEQLRALVLVRAAYLEPELPTLSTLTLHHARRLELKKSTYTMYTPPLWYHSLMISSHSVVLLICRHLTLAPCNYI